MSHNYTNITTTKTLLKFKILWPSPVRETERTERGLVSESEREREVERQQEREKEREETERETTRE